MARPIGTYGLYQAMMDEGYKFPDETAYVEVRMGVDEVMQMMITVNMTTESCQQLARALVRMAKEQER